MKKIILIFIIFIGCLLSQRNKYIINPSKSLTRGIYKTFPVETINKGDIVVFNIPNDMKKMAKEREYILKDAQTLMKIVAATKDDMVTIKNDELFINGISWGKMAYKDSHSRKLEPKSEKELQPKNDDEYLLLSKVKNSFDGRYIGVVKRKDIIYKAELFIKF
ncbi:conjugal transfer peptidase TraF [Fusobacterium necrogenes]|uniref:Conjugal transfer peptidase TraF n=1 Tax=Fusobacterium necrogenes TaxID=858 RepID=A0A377GPN5_9FUSO|nr:S26 family signal peptidase [Fusobacterium necrogenes]STO28732.1 conjugal transfer peptidase TraF [Fusobacterium necrogenes]